MFTRSGPGAQSLSPFNALSIFIAVIGWTTLQQGFCSGSGLCVSTLDAYSISGSQNLSCTCIGILGFSLSQSPLSTDFVHLDRFTEYSMLHPRVLLPSSTPTLMTIVLGCGLSLWDPSRLPATRSTRLATGLPLTSFGLAFALRTQLPPLPFLLLLPNRSVCHCEYA